MILPKQTCRAGHSADFGTFTIALSGGSLVGSKVIAKFGETGNVTTTLDSSDDLTGQLSWDEETGEAEINLTAETVDALPAKETSYQLSLILADDTPVFSGIGNISRLPAL